MPSKPVAMDIGSGRVARFNVREDILDYFNIAEDTKEPEAKLRRRKAHTRSLYDGLTDTSRTSTNVEASEWYDVSGGVSRFGAGKPIKVPTELKTGTTGRETVRHVVIRVPQSATNFAIATWIDLKFFAHKPSYFITPNGRRYPTNVPRVSDVDPGDDVTPPPSGG